MTPKEVHQQLETQMAIAVRDLIGSGYISDYYRSLAQDFIRVAEWYAEASNRSTRHD